MGNGSGREVKMGKVQMGAKWVSLQINLRRSQRSTYGLSVASLGVWKGAEQDPGVGFRVR